MRLGKLRDRQASTRRRPLIERLERRELFAIYLPDSFANPDLQPVGSAFNQGEQMFFGGHGSGLQFEFGSSAAGANYNGPGWNRRDVDELDPTALPDVDGTVSLYYSPSGAGQPLQQHAVYRTSDGKIIDVWSTPWQSRELVASGAASDPTATNFNYGRQILYVGTDGHVYMVASADLGATWNTTDLTTLLGLNGDASAVAVATSGVASLQTVNGEFYVHHRADGGLGVFTWAGGAWSYNILDATDFPGYISPTTGARGQLEGVSYDPAGGSSPTVGWVMFRDGSGTLRGVWLSGGVWMSAKLSNVQMQGVPSAEFNPSTKKLNVAFVDTNGHLHLLQEGATWSDHDYHASPTLSMPLANMGTEARAGKILKFADGSEIAISAEQAGTEYNGVLVVFASGATRSAAYDSGTKTLTVTVTGNTSAADIATEINLLPEFTSVRVGDIGIGFTVAGDGYGQLAVLGGGTAIRPGNASRPDLYFRAHASSAIPSMHLLYKDQSNHVHNVRVNDGLTLDTTAYMEGYRATYGYGIVNAAAAVAYALNTSTPLNGSNPGAWNLNMVRATNVWDVTTGQNVAVFSIDSGIDSANTDVLQLAGYNFASGNSNTTDTNGHGTGVASIIAGVNDGSGVTGVAFNARVVPVKVGDGSANSEAGVVAGIKYAADYVVPNGYVDKTKVINLSLASSGSMSAVRDEMYKQSWDTVFVSAAGNRTQGTSDYPARYSVGFGIVAGAIDSASKLWSPTNGTAGAITPYNYLLAPGASVTASTVVGSSGNNHNTTTVSGTSAAAAHISGVVALMMQANPNLTAREIESILIASADQVVSQTISATAPSINASIYWAGEDSTASLADAFPAELPKTSESDATAEPALAEATPASQPQFTAPPILLASGESASSETEYSHDEACDDVFTALGESLASVL